MKHFTCKDVTHVAKWTMSVLDAGHPWARQASRVVHRLRVEVAAQPPSSSSWMFALARFARPVEQLESPAATLVQVAVVVVAEDPKDPNSAASNPHRTHHSARTSILYTARTQFRWENGGYFQ